MSPLSATTIATTDNEQASLISALTTPAEIGNDGQQSSEEPEEERGEDGAESDPESGAPGSSFGSNALSEEEEQDDYFKPDLDDIPRDPRLRQQQQQQQELQPPPQHQSNDSLCYSTDNDFDLHTIGSASTISYLSSVVRSLDAQQAFPSSMFPGQKLISPSSERVAIDETPRSRGSGAGGGISAYPSYYYYSTSSLYKDSYQNSGGGGGGGSGSGSNVYQKRHGELFWNEHPDGDVEEEDEGVSGTDPHRDTSWKRCWGCFFSPRVVVTLAVCGIIVLNLLRLGGHHHGQPHRLDRHNHWSSLNDNDNSNTGYVQLETMRVAGRSSSSSNRFDDREFAGNRRRGRLRR